MKAKHYLGIFLVALSGGLVALGINNYFNKKSETSSFESLQKQNAKYASLFSSDENQSPFDFVKVSEVSTPTVVHIKSYFGEEKTSKNSSPHQMNPFDFFNLPEGFDFNVPRGPGVATGSGVIITADGYITTNNHVIDNATKIEVTLNDKRTYIAELVGTDKTTDLALLKINEKNLSFMSFGNSDEVKVGQWVVAVGNPMNLTSTVTAGIVSAKGRSIDLLRSQDNQYAIENFIQTDAAINPGNSGGALVNTKGELIGINTAIASQTGSYTGYGFAVPVNLVKKVMDDILKFGKVQRAVLGVAIQEVTQELAEKENLKELKGVFVQQVTENTAASAAGIEKGDVILRINSIEVNSVSSLQEEIGKYRPGDKVNLSLLRKGKAKDISVTLKSIEGKETTSVADKSEESKIMGMQMQSLSNEDKEKFGVKNGVKIIKVDKGPFKGKLQEGCVITKIDKQAVFSMSNLKKILENTEGAVLIEGKNPDGSEFVVGTKIEK